MVHAACVEAITTLRTGAFPPCILLVVVLDMPLYHCICAYAAVCLYYPAVFLYYAAVCLYYAAVCLYYVVYVAIMYAYSLCL